MSGRIRTIKPEMMDDVVIAGLAHDAFRLWIGLFTIADDFGRFRAEPAQLVGHIFWKTPPTNPIEDSIRALAPLVIFYDVKGQRYGEIRNWDKHQKISHKGAERLPRPPESLRQSSGEPAEDERQPSALISDLDLRSGSPITDQRTRPGTGPCAPEGLHLRQSVRDRCEQAGARMPTEADVVVMAAWFAESGKRSNDWEASLVKWMCNAKAIEAKVSQSPNDGRSQLETVYAEAITKGRGAPYSCPPNTDPLLRRTFQDQGYDENGCKLGPEDLEPWLSHEAEVFARWLLRECKTESRKLGWYSNYDPKGFQKRMNEIGAAEAVRNGAA